jgi:hypothetical protein
VTVRCYVPATVDLLRVLVDGGRLPDDLERIEAAADDEESEYDALMAAAAAAAAHLDGPGRRVVVVAEVDPAGSPISLGDVVAVHCDVEDRPPDADPDDDLAWFATQEIPGLV